MIIGTRVSNHSGAQGTFNPCQQTRFCQVDARNVLRRRFSRGPASERWRLQGGTIKGNISAAIIFTSDPLPPFLVDAPAYYSNAASTPHSIIYTQFLESWVCKGSQQGGIIKGNIAAATLNTFLDSWVCKGSQQGGIIKGNISAATLNSWTVDRARVVSRAEL